jgi:lactoylglutathione lyase
MKGRIDLVTLLVDDVPRMVTFFRDVLGSQPKTDLGKYVEFTHDGVRFAICARSELVDATKNDVFTKARGGQYFELAFPLDKPEEVDKAYDEIVAKGARPIQAPANMPWGQRTAFFADPEGNIHELFAGPLS